MDNFLKQLFPEGEQRWIKVKFTDPEKAMQNIRFNSNGFNNDNLGIEVISIGLREEYMPQVEALLELKAEIGRDMNFYDSAALDSVNAHIDRKIEEVLTKVLLTK